MKKLLTVAILLLLSVAGANAQTLKRLKVYQKDATIDTLYVTSGETIAHSRYDLQGRQQSDYVTIQVTTDDGLRQYLISNLDSIVLPNGRRVVFRGVTTGQPVLAKDAPPVWDGVPSSNTPRKTSLSGNFPGTQGSNNVTFYWTDNDRIRIESGDVSRAEKLSADRTRAEFVFEGADDLDAPFYQVYFPDKKVTIKTEQTQMGDDNTEHIGSSGDSGTARAILNEDDGSYSFTLQHKSAYLCFLPHIDYLPSAKLTKIELSSTAAIAGDYSLSSSGLYGVENPQYNITLNLESPDGTKGFFIGHEVGVKQDTCAAYMVIAPIGGDFTATYYITDTLSHISKIYRQPFSLTAQPNTVYPITCRIRDTEFRAIDLGLSTNWSNVNAKATEPSKKGTLYASDSEANTALLEETKVTEWLMPTDEQKQELIDKCSWQWGIYNGKEGYFVTGASPAKEYGEKLRIFIPASQEATPEECLAQNSRPVESLMIDLGLPTGTKWAARNVGANSATEAGTYFAWGETAPKIVYNSSTAVYPSQTQNLGNDLSIAGTPNDAAAVLWGGIWTMPTADQWRELMSAENCTWTRQTINGINGFLVTGKKEGYTDRNIFLPEAGFMKERQVSYFNGGGSYWTANLGGSYSWYAKTMDWSSRDSYARSIQSDRTYYPFNSYDDGAARYWGRPVRAVASPNVMDESGLVLNIVTDSATWKLGDGEAMIYGTLSSTTPLVEDVTVGFVVGDNADIDIDHRQFAYSKTTSLSGNYSFPQQVYNNLGYWYRAFVKVGDNYYYGQARHFGFELVDLGLSVKWANMNLGASQPSDYGDLYAWGETEPKQTFNSGNYEWYRRYSYWENLGHDLSISGTDQDAAHEKMGSIWRMPTRFEMAELINEENCSWEWTSENGISGYRVTSKKPGYTDNSIFLPAAGFKKEESPNFLGTGGSYWTANQGGDRSAYSYTMSWNTGRDGGVRTIQFDRTYYPFNYYEDGAARYWGRSIRAVASPMLADGSENSYGIATDGHTWRWGDTEVTLSATLTSSLPITESVKVGFVVGDDTNIDKDHCRSMLSKEVTADGTFSLTTPVHDNMGYYYRAYVETTDGIIYGDARHYGLEMVDLGLSVKWANMNVGASAPEDSGDYFAWGETAPKENYTNTVESYPYQNYTQGDSLNIADTQRDAAHVVMGNAWVMPNYKEWEELTNAANCSWTWGSENGVLGYRVTSLKPGYTDKSIFLPAAGYMDGTTPSFTYKNSNTGYHGGSYWTSQQGGVGSWYAYTMSWSSGYGNSTRYLPGGNNYEPFWGYGCSTVVYWGRSVRAVAKPNVETADGKVMHVRTDSVTWKLNDTSAILHATLSSTTQLDGNVTVGFILGDSDDIVWGSETGHFEQTLSATGTFSSSPVTVTDNMGKWFRAYVKVDGQYYYGKALHYGWEMVDLGLPSGVLWANMNVGASAPEDYGDYFAWGETRPKDSYTSTAENYPLQTQNPNGTTEITSTSYDAAYMNMNSNWRMPTYSDWKELTDNCDWKPASQGNVYGYYVIGPNKRSIFLPAAGYIDGTTPSFTSTNSNTSYRGGSYWSATLGGSNSRYAYTMSWCSGYNNGTRYLPGGNNSEPFWSGGRATVRYWGRPVRAVAVRTRFNP